MWSFSMFQGTKNIYIVNEALNSRSNDDIVNSMMYLRRRLIILTQMTSLASYIHVELSYSLLLN